MTPLQFEQMYQDEWTELEALLDRASGRNAGEPASGRQCPALGSRRSTGARVNISRSRGRAPTRRTSSIASSG